MNDSLLVDQSLIIEDQNTLKMRDQFEESLGKSFIKNGISIPKREITKKDIEYMQKFLNRQVNYSQMLELIKEFGEKPIIVNCFESNRFAFDSHMKELKLMSEQSFDNYEVSEELGKELLNDEESTQIRLHSCHFNKGLGDNAGTVSLTNRGYVWQLFADGYLREIDGEGVKKLVFERYSIVLLDETAAKIASDMNRDRRKFEGSMLQGTIGDSPTVKDAISIITNNGKKNSLSYESTNIMGEQARKIIEKTDHQFGKIVGQAMIEGNSDGVKTKLSRMFANIIETMNLNADDVLALTEKSLKK